MRPSSARIAFAYCGIRHHGASLARAPPCGPWRNTTCRFPRTRRHPRPVQRALVRSAAAPAPDCAPSGRPQKPTQPVRAPSAHGRDDCDSRPPDFRKPLLFVLCHVLMTSVALSVLETWPFVDALYFSVVTATTVGFGDLVPTRAVSKLLVCVYEVVSVVLVGAFLATLFERCALAQHELSRAVQGRLSRGSARGAEEAEGETGVPDLVRFAQGDLRRARDRLRASLSLVLLMCVLGALLYGYFLQSLSAVDTIYFVVTSLTTTGFGDIHPVSRLGKMIAVVWIVLSSIGFGTILSQWAHVRLLARQVTNCENLVLSATAKEQYAEIDSSGDGMLSEAEYLAFVLCKLGKAEPAEVSAIRGRFRELDSDGNGFVTRNELETD